RDRSLDEGLEELVDAVECYRDRPVAELTDALAAELTRPGEQSDDVCVLAIRRTG
ncbi:MAG: hypothetical protein QOG77_1412, partial [Solirubrobacteraceae bacterium]|nr:hypothetical protein [Solirubrobacteraceae bacterium]